MLKKSADFSKFERKADNFFLKLNFLRIKKGISGVIRKKAALGNKNLEICKKSLKKIVFFIQALKYFLILKRFSASQKQKRNNLTQAKNFYNKKVLQRLKKNSFDGWKTLPIVIFS
jgi:hypothetical protein